MPKKSQNKTESVEGGLLALQRVTASIQSALELNQVLQEISKIVVQDLGYDHTFISLLDEEKKVFRVVALTTGEPGIANKAEALIRQSIAGFEAPTGEGRSDAIRTMLEGKVYVTNSLYDLAGPWLSKPICFAMQKLSRAKTFLDVPLIAGQKVLGGLTVFTKKEQVAEQEVESLLAIGNQAGIAIVNARLHEEVRKRAEEIEQRVSELEQSKAYIESMFNALADSITVVDVNLRFIAVNKAATELLGYREDELIGCPTSKLLVPRERHLSGKITPKVVATGKTFKYERTLLTKDGTEIPVVFHGAPLRDAKGEIIGSIAVARDMREVKSLISELEHRKAFVEHLFSALADAVIVMDGEGTIVTVNRAATELLGYREDELVGQNTRVLLVPEQRHLGGTGRKEAIAKSDSVQYERKHQTKDGVEIPVLLHTSPLRDSQGAIIGSISVIRDIREIKSFITRLTRSEERYRALLEYAPVPIGVVDRGNIVTLWNRQAEKHMGYKAEEIIGKSTRMLIPDDLYEEGKWLMREVREKGYVKEYETERINSNGVRLSVEVTIAALRDEGGNFIGAEFMVRDILERKRLERERAEAQERMIRAEKLAAIGELAAGVAHELRQPLSVINNSVYFLKMKLGAPDEKVTKHLDILKKEVDISEKIISDLLDFAKPKRLALEQAELNSIIEQALSRAQLPPEVEVVTELKELPPIKADAEQFERVFLNVILNAAQAMTDGGKLVISTESEGDVIKAEVKDNGIGILGEDLGKVFKPLYTKKAKGIGLGLTLAKSIIEDHQGTIEIKSQSGHGSTVTIKLPIEGVGNGD